MLKKENVAPLAQRRTSVSVACGKVKRVFPFPFPGKHEVKRFPVVKMHPHYAEIENTSPRALAFSNCFHRLAATDADQNTRPYQPVERIKLRDALGRHGRPSVS